MLLRPADADDAPTLSRCYREASGRAHYQIDPARLVHLALVLCDDDAPIGFAIGDRFGPDVAELENIWVAPARQGQGLGTRLLAAWATAARAEGYAAAVAVNSMAYHYEGVKRPADGLYERAGWQALLRTPVTTIWGRSLLP